jgi:integrase/recombinase XerD
MQKQTTRIYKQEIFIEYLQLKNQALTTREGIIKTVRHFTHWCESENVPLQQVSYNDMMAYANHCKSKGNSQRTVQILLNQLKHYYSFLMQQQEVAENPCSNIKIHGVKRKTLYATFTTEELEIIYRKFAEATVHINALGNPVTHKRNKVILGLIIYQGLSTQELAELKVTDVLLQQGKIKVEASRQTEGRELKLEAFQLYDLMDYINETRKLLLAISAKQTDKLFLSTGGSDRFTTITQAILQGIKKYEPRVKEIKQLRASVITNWLKLHNIRKVQQMAGHRYVSSTEAYQVNNMDDLKEDVNRYHPLN